MTDGQDQGAVELSVADEQLLRELTDRTSGFLPEECLKELDLPKMLRTPEPGKFYNSVDSAEEK